MKCAINSFSFHKGHEGRSGVWPGVWTATLRGQNAQESTSSLTSLTLTYKILYVLAFSNRVCRGKHTNKSCLTSFYSAMACLSPAWVIGILATRTVLNRKHRDVRVNYPGSELSRNRDFSCIWQIIVSTTNLISQQVRTVDSYLYKVVLLTMYNTWRHHS